MERDERNVNIVTPEHIQIQFQTAGIGSRGIAVLIDSLLVLAADVFLTLLYLFAGKYLGLPYLSSYLRALLIVLLFLINFGYFIILEYSGSGKTVGKRIMHLRVLQANGQAVTFLSAAVRNLFRIIDILPFNYFVGALVSFFHRQDKRLGDIVAGTVVVIEAESKRKKAQKKLNQFLRRYYPQLSSLQTGELPVQKLDYEDWQLLSTFVERLPMLSRYKRLELAEPIAEHMRSKLTTQADELEKPVLRSQEEHLLSVISLYFLVKDEWDVL